MGANETDVIRGELFALGDPDYALFTARLVPTVSPDRIIGVRVPRLRRYARGVPYAAYAAFFHALPHEYLDENNLHACLLSHIKQIDLLYEEIDRFLPYIDNWMTADMLSPPLLGRDLPRLSAAISRWLVSPHPFAVRFGIVMRMKYFLGEGFLPAYHDEIAALGREEYYIGMAAAWYFATALALRYEDTLGYLTEGRLSPFVHHTAISKACDSYRVPEEHKRALRVLRSLK